MFLELGIWPLKYVIIAKRLNFLKYILSESTTTLIRQVYDVLKQESRKGDFVYLVQKDLHEINMEMSDEQIHPFTNLKWQNIVKQKVNQAAFKHLISENMSKEKTKHFVFDTFEMRKYLFVNRSTSLARILFLFDQELLKSRNGLHGNTMTTFV